MEKFQKFIPLTKVEEQSDGSLYVYGEVTAERPDRDGEICKYSGTVPFYKAYAEELKKATNDAGIEENIMPLREMHQLSAVGAGKQMDFFDDLKTIKIGFSVVDEVAIKKIKKGVYTGFSQGGQYVKTWMAKWDDGKVYKWYIANPGETSLVDSPCLPTAHFDYVKADGSKELRKFATEDGRAAITEADAELIAAALKRSLVEKADSSKEPYGDVHYADPGYQSDKKKRYPLDTEEHIRAAWNYIHQEKNGEQYSSADRAKVIAAIEAAWKKKIDSAGPPSAKKTRVMVSLGTKDGACKALVISCLSKDFSEVERTEICAAVEKFSSIHDQAENLDKAIEYLGRAAEVKPLEKGMYEVGSMAQLLQTLGYLQASAAYERDYENDQSSQPEDLAELLSRAITCFTSMVAEETSELASHAAAVSAATTKGAKAMTQEELNKAANELLAKAKGASHHLNNLKAHVDKMQEHVEKASQKHADMCKTAHEHIAKCMKAMGVEGQPVGGEAEEGRPAGGTPSGDAAKAFDAEDFAKSILTKMQEMIDENQKTLITAIFSDGGTPVAKATPGLGDRGMVLPGAPGPKANSIPVTKAQDNTDPARREQNDQVTPEDVRKANSGDMEARLKLAKLARPATGQESERLVASMASAAVRR